MNLKSLLFAIMVVFVLAISGCLQAQGTEKASTEQPKANGGVVRELPQVAEEILTPEMPVRTLTVYSSGKAYIERAGEVLFQKAGSYKVMLRNVTAKAYPDSFYISGKGAELLEYDYKKESESIKGLKQQLFGKVVTLGVEDGKAYKGTLQSNDASEYVLSDAVEISNGTQEAAGKTVVVIPSTIKYILTDESVKDVKAEQANQLLWIANAGEAGKREFTVTYLSDGMSWKPSYRLYLPADEKGSAQLQMWTQVVNDVEDFSDVILKVVAGSPNFVENAPVQRAYAKAVGMEYAMSAPSADIVGGQYSGSNAEEYHIYTLNRLASIAKGETKHIPMSDDSVEFERYYDWSANYDTQVSKKVIAKNALGKPLPSGKVFAYSEGEFVGQDTVGYVADKENATITLGKALDITTAKDESSEIIGTEPFGQYEEKTTRDYVVKLTLRNRKASAANVWVHYTINADAKISSSSVTPDEDKDGALLWKVDVPASSEKVIEFKYRLTCRGSVYSGSTGLAYC